MITTAAIAVGGMLMSANSANKANKATKEGQRMAGDQADSALAFQKEQQARLDEQKQRYRNFEFKNPYANLENPYANMENKFAGMENTMEDLTVNQKAAKFQMEQGTQQRSNIMSQLRGAAGSSGIAGLAQSLASQGTLQARQVSADIGQQESRNQAASAQSAMQIQQMERQGASQVQQMQAQGQSAVDMARMGGDAMVQEAEMQRQSTLLGVEYQMSAGAAGGVQQAYANQMQMNFAQSQAQAQNSQMYGNMASSVIGADNFEW